MSDRTCGHKFVVVNTCAICAAYVADLRLSDLHDALYEFFQQPRMPDQQRAVEQLRKRSDELIWKMHDALRKHVAPASPSSQEPPRRQP